MRKVMTVVGTRPELIKLSLVIQEMDRRFNHILVHTGQNFDFELNEIFFRDLGLRKPNHFLQCAGKTAMETVAAVLVHGDRVLEEEKPDALLVYGDTHSCLITLAAKRRKIPIFHMEAGNRCFDARVPEEINRKIVDHLSDINMPLTEQGRYYLLNEGLPANRVIKIGSCMKEILDHFREPIEKSQILSTLNLKPDSYFIVSAHREENVDQPKQLRELIKSLEFLAVRLDKKVIFSVHPRTKKRIDELGLDLPSDKVLFSKPLGFFDYIHLQCNSYCVLSDSGTLMEEAALLGFSAVMLRDCHERPEGNDAGVLVSSIIERERILEAVELVIAQRSSSRPIVRDYEVTGVARSVTRIIASQIETINRETWKLAPSAVAE